MWAHFLAPAKVNHWREIEGPSQTQGLYCFFSHANSVRDSIAHFAHIVNQLLPETHPAFKVEPASPSGTAGSNASVKSSPRLWKCCHRFGTAYKRLIGDVSGYRNLLVHEKPIFVRNTQGLPKVDHPGSTCLPKEVLERAEQQRVLHPHLDYLSGLTAIEKAQKSPSVGDECYEPVHAVIGRVCEDSRQAAGRCQEIADYRLDALGPTYWDAQSGSTLEIESAEAANRLLPAPYPHSGPMSDGRASNAPAG